jgi:hypothetical protein
MQDIIVYDLLEEPKIISVAVIADVIGWKDGRLQIRLCRNPTIDVFLTPIIVDQISSFAYKWELS